MTKHEIEAVLDRVRTWPPAKQEEAAAILLALEAEEGSYEPTEEEMAAIREGLAQAERSEFASDEEVQELLRRPWTR
jgi:predicted transcriptional regulator